LIVSCSHTLLLSNRNLYEKYSVYQLSLAETDDLYMEGDTLSLLAKFPVNQHSGGPPDPEIWPEPMTFDPSRFAWCQDRTFHLTVPGPRNCLGQHLALLEQWWLEYNATTFRWLASQSKWRLEW
jgi:hypothetical protein